MRKAAFLGIALVTLTAATAIGQAPSEVRSISRIGPNGDPNQVICVRQSHIQSPLDVRRICRTRAEWVQLRTDTRNVVDRVQFYKPTF